MSKTSLKRMDTSDIATEAIHESMTPRKLMMSSMNASSIKCMTLTFLGLLVFLFFTGMIGTSDDDRCSCTPGSEDCVDIVLSENGKTYTVQIRGYIPKAITTLFNVSNAQESSPALSNTDTKEARVPAGGSRHKAVGLPKLYIKALGGFSDCIVAIMSGYSLARQTKHLLALSQDFASLKTTFPHLYISNSRIPDNIITLEERSHAAFTPDMVTKIPPTDVFISGYLQAYKYSQNYSKELKNLLAFSESIQRISREIMTDVSKFGQSFYGNGANLSYIGIHIRRIELLAANVKASGYNVADERYLQVAMHYFRYKYTHTVFLVSTDDQDWTSNVLKNERDVWLVDRTHSPEVQLSILSLCNHTIMTVGTFGWVAGWMAQGEVVYYEPAMDYTRSLGRGFCAFDYYPPTWLPLSLYDVEVVEKIAQAKPPLYFDRPCPMEETKPQYTSMWPLRKPT